MFNVIKNKINEELEKYISYVDKKYNLHRISPLLLHSIKEFVLRDGKRLRPALFVIGYKGFSAKTPKNLFRSALSMELLHDFFLIHDDIVDKSNMRRGKPTMHIALDEKIKKAKKAKLTGQDLAIITGDILYSLAMESFLSIKTSPARKEKALIKFIEAACYTGCGEYIEMLLGSADIKNVTKNKIYEIYDYKTAHYTFIAPLTAGAILANASKREVKQLSELGINLGRAFQIKDDILGIFGNESSTGKSSLTDLEEDKKTLLTWHAYNNASEKQQSIIRKITTKGKLTREDLNEAQRIIKNTGSLEYAEKEIQKFVHRSLDILKASKMKLKYKNGLLSYIKKILNL